MSFTLPADWLEIRRGEAPLLVSLPHTGTHLPPELLPRLVSPWRATRDADWWIDKLYDFAGDLGATIVRTGVSRTFIDVNRDPSGASLYPGQATTELCPTTTFDSEPLYVSGQEPNATDIARRRKLAFEPYHAALRAELDRLRAKHACVVLYDCHSIRSVIPRLFDGELPIFNIGTNAGRSCDATLLERIEALCDASGLSRVSNGRFKAARSREGLVSLQTRSTPCRWNWLAAAICVSRSPRSAKRIGPRPTTPALLRRSARCCPTSCRPASNSRGEGDPMTSLRGASATRQSIPY